MSCNCNHTDDTHQFSCPCDSFVHPLKLNIGMGLTDIPRQIAGFPEFRKAMLFSLRPKDPSDTNKIALNDWKARQQDDLGIMLLEMWAYICDSLSFYDKVIAQEEYLRTALRRPSLRRLVALLGYLPGPAVGSSVYLAALAEGRLRLKIPVGTAFRSAGFDGNLPQVFEMDEDAFIHPLTNRWSVKAPQPDFIESANPPDLLVVPKIEIKPAIPLLLLDTDNFYTQALWVSGSELYTGADDVKYRKITFNSNANLPVSYPLKNLQLYMPIQSAGLWAMTVPGIAAETGMPANATLILDSLYRQIKSGQYILISLDKICRWYKVTGVADEIRKQTAGGKIIINKSEFDTPGISVPVTKLIIDKSINDPSRKNAGDTEDWTDANRGELLVHFIMQIPGTIINEQKTTLSFDDPVLFKEKSEKPTDDFDPVNFFLTDKNTRGVKLKGQLDYNVSSLTPVMGKTWTPGLILPVDAFGNVIKASRGEKVTNEILGSGNAIIINQAFKLEKKPLTYFPAPSVANDQGLKNTLLIYVNGIRWTEVRSFFNKHDEDEIYIVRQNDDGDSIVTFGDGIRGRRLPTGIDNISASYRFGAELAAPPAGAINQISKPVKGFTGVDNPIPASGGQDAEQAGTLRTSAPKSILTLGRIVSIQDVEAVSLTVSGVRAVQVEWGWHGEKQCPLLHIWYIGDSGVGEILSKRLRSLSDPSVTIYSEIAEGKASSIKIDMRLDPRFVEEDVLKEVRSTFINPETGQLAPENISIGKPLFLSKIFAIALSVPGVLAVNDIFFNDEIFPGYAKSPGAGKYFDFETGSLLLTTNE